MALKLGNARPEFRPVQLGYGAQIMLRPASWSEVQEAAADAASRIAGVVSGSAAAAELAPLIGEEFAIAEMSDGRLAAASDKLALIALVMKCQGGWSGIVGDDEKPIETPTDELVALLLKDVVIARRLRAVVEAPYHQEYGEGNA